LREPKQCQDNNGKKQAKRGIDLDQYGLFGVHLDQHILKDYHNNMNTYLGSEDSADLPQSYPR
jgi:hypothetical protein